MKDAKQCANCGKILSTATATCDCIKTALKDKSKDAPSVVAAGGPSTEYEFTTPGEYGAGTGEYEFGLLQNKQTTEHVLDAKYEYATAEGIETLDVSDDDDEVGSTLIMDKPNIKKTIAPESAVLPERAQPAAAIKYKPKPNSNVMHPGLFIALVVLFITFIGVMFFFASSATRHFKTGVQDQTSSTGAPTQTGGERVSPLSQNAGSSDKVKYALGYAPFTAASQGGLKYKTNVVSFDGFSDDKISKLQDQKCTDISLEGISVSDNDLKRLSKLQNIYMLDLQNTHGYSPEGLRAFKGTPLKRLHLDGADISEDWIPMLAELPVDCLTLMGNKLSEESILTLAKSKTLKYLKFEGDNSIKVGDAFNHGGWLRLPEGSDRAFNYYRNWVKEEAQ